MSFIISAENVHTHSLKINKSRISDKYQLNMFWIMYFSKLEMISWFHWGQGPWMPANVWPQIMQILLKDDGICDPKSLRTC